MDLASLLPKAGGAVGGPMDSDLGAMGDGPSAEDLAQSLVFTNSHHNGRTATHSYAHATANSYAHAASASTTYAHAALVQKAMHTYVNICKHQHPLHMLSSYTLGYVIILAFLLTLSVFSPGFWFWLSECT